MGKHAAHMKSFGRLERRPGRFRAKAELDRNTTCRGPWRESEAEADSDLFRARQGENREEFRAILQSIMEEARDGGGGGAHSATTPSLLHNPSMPQPGASLMRRRAGSQEREPSGVGRPAPACCRTAALLDAPCGLRHTLPRSPRTLQPPAHSNGPDHGSMSSRTINQG